CDGGLCAAPCAGGPLDFGWHFAPILPPIQPDTAGRGAGLVWAGICRAASRCLGGPGKRVLATQRPAPAEQGAAMAASGTLTTLKATTTSVHINTVVAGLIGHRVVRFMVDSSQIDRHPKWMLVARRVHRLATIF